jgi:glucan-binding YG repeat protein
MRGNLAGSGRPGGAIRPGELCFNHRFPRAGGISGAEAHAAEAQAKGQWVQSGSRRWYRNADGSYPANCWQKIDGDWYHFDASGWMQTGWLLDGGDWYYLLSDGKMAMGPQDVGGKVYLFDNSGRLAYNKAYGPGVAVGGWNGVDGPPTVCSDSEGILVPSGWKYVDASDGYPGGWCYLDQSSEDPRWGDMHFFWKQIGGSWYYFMPTGPYPPRAFMVTGWQKIGTGYLTRDGRWWLDQRFYDDAQWYYFSASGAMQTGWVNDGGSWYWLTESGAMGTGWQLVNGTWYWFNASGAMQTGWQQVNGSWYYLSASGAMLHDCWVGNYYLGSSGAMLTNARTPDGYYVGADGAWVPGK